MRIVAIEYYVFSHLETLGFFYYLYKLYNSQNVDVDIYVWNRNLNHTWLKFFETYVGTKPNIRSIETFFDTKLDIDVLFINSMDVLKSNDPRVVKINTFHNVKKFMIQKHQSSIPDLKFPFSYEKVSLFPMEGATRLLIPYSIEKPRERTIGIEEHLKLTIVGNPTRTKKEILTDISNKFDITHYYQVIANNPKNHMSYRLPNIEYQVNKSTDEMAKKLIEDTDYIFIDYVYDDRMSGIILQAISMEVPFILNKRYFDNLDIPADICIIFETSKDLLDNDKIFDPNSYRVLVENIRKYKECLIKRAIDYFVS